jgi:hypothetical protein
MSFIPSYSGLTKYLAIFSLYDFSLGKKLKDTKVMVILENFNAIATVATIVTIASAIYFSKPAVAGFGVILLPFSFFSWFYSKEFHQLFVLDGARNTIEQSAKNVQISAVRVQEKREIILQSVEKLEQASSKIVDDSAVLSLHEVELKKIACDVKEGNRVKKKVHKAIKEEVEKMQEMNQRFTVITEEFNGILKEGTQKDAEESKLFDEKVQDLMQRRATLAAIAKKVAKMIELKIQLEQFRLEYVDEFEKIVKKIPLLEDL